MLSLFLERKDKTNEMKVFLFFVKNFRFLICFLPAFNLLLINHLEKMRLYSKINHKE